jgi:iron complex outermembrane receptor protein
LVNSSVEINDGLDAPWFLDGPSGFARVDARVGQTKFRSFWNNERQDFRGFPGGTLQGINFNAYDASLEHSLSLPFQNALTLGASYRRNVARAPFFGKPVTQDLWAVFFENQWRPVDRWTLVASGRLDRHPLTDYTFSPRGSIIFQPEERQTLRLSAGSSFRNPTLAENHLRLLEPTPNPGTDVPNPPYSTLQFDVLGDRGLEPEKMTVVELAHMGRFGRFRTTTAAYRYVLSNMIHNTSLSAVSVVPPTMELMTSFGNGGSMKAWGGEFGVDFLAGKGVTCFANYSYVSLKSDQSSSNLGNLALSTPRHKINGGIRFAGAGWRANLWADWVDEVFWGNTSITAPANDRRVPAYTLLNGRISYMFSGHLRGLELGVNAFNFANKKHYEFDSQSYGEIIKARWMATASYRF